MDFLTELGVFNYGLVLLYGLFLSTHIAGGWATPREKRLILIICPFFLLIQSAFWLALGVDTTKQLYPLIVHLPLILILVLGLKKPISLAVVSVCTAYLCCQLPRWFNLACTALTGSPLMGELCYTVVIVPIYLLLYRYFVRTAHDAITYSPKILFLFGSLPFVYYIQSLPFPIPSFAPSSPTAWKTHCTPWPNWMPPNNG